MPDIRRVSTRLEEFIAGGPKMARTEVVKKLWLMLGKMICNFHIVRIKLEKNILMDTIL